MDERTKVIEQLESKYGVKFKKKKRRSLMEMTSEELAAFKLNLDISFYLKVPLPIISRSDYN
jgi:hypothetical protein